MLTGLGEMGAESHGVALAATGGNVDAAHTCHRGGCLTLHSLDGTTFTNAGQCVSFIVRGGFSCHRQKHKHQRRSGAGMP
jgi:hypothetical protein